jgi:hypothetical protein
MDTFEQAIGPNGQEVRLTRHPVRDFQAYIVDRPEKGEFTRSL